MFGGGFPPCSLPCCSQPMMCPYPVPVPQPMPYPVDRPCAMPVPVPQPYLVQQQVPVPYPVPVPQYHPSPIYEHVEHIYEEPVRIIRRRRRRRHHRCCSPYPPPPLPPLVIPIPMQAPVVAVQQPQYQVTEYIQDIYPPAQVFTEQVPVGFVANDLVSHQTSLNNQPGIILRPTSSVAPVQRQQPQIVQQLSNGQLVQRPLSVGGGGIQTTMLQQAGISSPYIQLS